jgi:hypothetical protein
VRKTVSTAVRLDWQMFGVKTDAEAQEHGHHQEAER